MLRENKQLGFTIVELIIAVAIMGIIAALIFVGINQFTSNKRDDLRKADAARMLEATRQWVNDNNGVLPQSNADLASVESNYIVKQSGTAFYAPGTSTVWQLGLSVPPPAVNSQVILYVGAPAVCNGNIMAAGTTGSRQIAVEVYQESGGTYCIAQ